MTSLKAALLKEETTAYNIALDFAGLIPGLGEFADAANALDYAKKGDYILSALSIISMIPEIGDIVGKGGKISMWVAKTFPKTFTTVQKHGPDVVQAMRMLRETIRKNKPVIDKIILALKQDPKFEELKSHLPRIQEVINMFMKDEGEKKMQSLIDPSLAKDPVNVNAAIALKEWSEHRRLMSMAGL
jgi:hypothetical protein